jgi:hypothetical protein
MIAKGIDEGATVRLPGLSLDGVDVGWFVADHFR